MLESRPVKGIASWKLVQRVVEASACGWRLDSFGKISLCLLKLIQKNRREAASLFISPQRRKNFAPGCPVNDDRQQGRAGA
jgi:hypothetical protein